MTTASAPAGTDRERAKAQRQAALLRESARLFADRGFAGVSLEDVGSAVGITGPAVYRHFASKQALLGAVLIGVSERLLSGGRDVAARSAAPHEQLKDLVDFHADFALADADVIRVQDRDLASLSAPDRHRVRRLQREYVEVWVDVLAGVRPALADAELRVRAHACFGLINSTPYSMRGTGSLPGDARVRGILAAMALAALRA